MAVNQESNFSDKNSEKLFRYAGTKSYDIEHKDLFFGRENETLEVYKLISEHRFTVIHAGSGTGKSSLLNAGLSNLLTPLKNEIVNIRFGNYTENTQNSPYKTLKNRIKRISETECYIDKIIGKEDSLWYHFKRLQAISEGRKPIILIFDQFEEFFGYPPDFKKYFLNELQVILNEIIPDFYKKEIKEKLADNSIGLTKQGLDLLYKRLNIKIVFSLKSDYIRNIEEISKVFPEVNDNVYRLPGLSHDQAKDAIILPGQYSFKYSSMNNFKSEIFTFSDSAVRIILKYLSEDATKEIEPFRLQIICSYFEREVINKGITKIEISKKEELELIYENYYRNIIAEIENPHHRIAAAIFIEEGLILESEERRLSLYEGVISSGYNVSKELLNILTESRIIKAEKNYREEVFYELSHETLVEPILHAKRKRLEQEKSIEEQLKKTKELEAQAVEQLKKNRKIKIIAGAILGALIISLFGIYQVNESRKEAENREAYAKSNMLSVYAFREMDNDPTVSFRLAEEAYKTDRTNTNAFSALINSYYSTEVFYSETGTLGKEVEGAKIYPGKNLIISRNMNLRRRLNYTEVSNLKGEVFFTIPNDDIVTFAGYSADMSKIFTGDGAGNISIYDNKGKELKSFKAHSSTTWAIAYSESGDRIISSGGDNKIKMWDLQGNFIKELPALEFDVYNICYSPDSKYIVTADDIHINLLDKEGRFIKKIISPELKNYFYPMIQYIEFSPDSKKILVVVNDMKGNNHTIRVIDLESGSETLLRGHTDQINTARFSADGKRIISASRDKTAICWKSSSEIIGVLKGHQSNVFDAVFAPDDKIITSSEDRTVKTWQFGKILNPLENVKNVNYARFTPDGLKVLTANSKDAVLWDLTGEQIAVFKGNNKKISCLDISKSGKYIVTGGQDSTARVWDISGNEIQILRGHQGIVNTAFFSNDSAFIVTTGSDKKAIVWNTFTGIPLQIFDSEASMNYATISPDGTRVVTGDENGKIVVRNIAGGTICVIHAHEAGINSVEFSSNGEFMISTANDKTTKIWRPNGKLIRTIEEYRNNVNFANFSPDGNYIITASDDKYLKVYDKSGKKVISFKHNGKVLNACFSPDSKYIISVYLENGKRKSKLWVIDPDKILELTDEIKAFGDFLQIDSAVYEQGK